VVVALRSLRVDASFDASGYARGAAQKVAADQAMIDGDRGRGAALAAADAQLQKTVPGVAALSRTFITGYSSGTQFESAIRRVGTAVDRGMGLDRAQVLLESVYRKFGLTADAAALAERGQSALLPIVTELNARYAAQSAILERNSLAARRMAEAQSYQAQINARVGVNDNFGGAGRGADIQAYGQALDDTRARFVPLFAAQRAYKAELNDLNHAYASGAIPSEREYRDALQRTKDAFAVQVQSIRGAHSANDNFAGSTRLSRYELINLSRQLQDVGVSLASGQSPFTVLVQQGTQIADVFAASEGTIGGFFRQTSSWLGGFLTAGRVAFGGVAAAIGVGIAALASYAGAQRDVQRSLTGIGRASGLTAGDINSIASSQGASPLGLSVSEAREIAGALAATGKIGKDAIGPLVGLAHDFAATLGINSTEAAKQLAQAFSDPIRGADTLNERLGFMDAAMRRQIKNLVEQNRLVEAQMLMVSAVESSLAKANTVTGFWSQTWNAISNAISNSYDWLGKILSRATGIGLTLEEQLENATRQRDLLKSLGAETSFTGRGSYAAAEAEVERLRKKVQEVADASAAAKARLESIRISDTIRAFLPEIDALQKLVNQRMTVGGASEDPVMLKALGLTQAQADRAKDIITDLERSFKTAFQEIQAQGQIAFDAITAFSPAEKAAIARREAEGQYRTRTDLSPNEKALLAEAAAARVLKQVTTELAEAQRERVLTAQQAVRTAELDVRLIGQSVGTQEQLRAELQPEQNLAAPRSEPLKKAGST
jgi:hypothetical protein